MLNRHTLRVKAMQAMFAYNQCKEANYNVAIEKIAQAYEPNMNIMELQDPVVLEEEKKGVLEVFKKTIKENSKDVADTNFSESILKEAEKAIEDYRFQVKKDLAFIKKNMMNEAGKLYDNYLKILNLLILFSGFAREGVGTRKSAPDTQLNLVNNVLISHLRKNADLKKLIMKNNLDWENENDMIRAWFRDIVTKDESYTRYLELTKPTAEDDAEIINHIVRKIIFKNETIVSFWEDQDLSWLEDHAIVRSMVLKTIKSLVEKGANFELAILSYNWEEDKYFFEKLFESTVKNERFLQDIVTEKTKNWEFDRIAYTDRLILMLAVSEMMNFPSIPVKVTINEYIEVSKNYSTPKSRHFVNGVLDVIAVNLQEKGLIKKSGRGLIDNK